jgi:N-carbamoyl-L-amino-acid hydrolase
MLFVPSVGGVSHSPRETTSDEHLVLGARALLRGVRTVAARIK